MRIIKLGFAAFVVSSLTVLAADTNWPQFRGPQASGVATGFDAPTSWNVETGDHIRWRKPIPGLAHSAPIVWGNRVYVATAIKPGKSDLKVGLYGDIDSVIEKEPQQWHLLALDKERGDLIWDQTAFEGVPKVKRHPKSSQCNSTPATDGKHIVAIFGSEGLCCFDMSGKLLWKKELGSLDSGYYRSPTAQWGFASSPVVFDGKVVVLCDVQKGSFLAEFNLADGSEVWRTERKDVPTWGTPGVIDWGGRRQIVVNGWHHTGGYDFLTGSEVWRLDGGGDIPVPTPIFGNGFVYLTSAHGNFRPMRAIRLDASGDITPADPGATNAAIAWAHARQGDYMQTPILVGETIYGCLDNAVLSAFDAKTGKLHFSERLVNGGEGFTASPVSDGKHLYFTSEVGNVFVVAPGQTLNVVATNHMGETCMATPALSEGTLFYRTRENLVAIGKK